MQVSRYIHLNPVEAKLSVDPEKYEWSSYQYFKRSENTPNWLRTSAASHGKGEALTASSPR